uniref:Conserved insect protein n=1 Tax=Culex tarsalis TaxID=7177 RepID=B8RIX1_CULTA
MTEATANQQSLCKSLGLKPLTKENILFFYIPVQSMVSYAALSVNVMNPSIAIRLLPKRDVTNFLLVHTLLGTTLYFYSRPHMAVVPGQKRAAYSIVGSALFSFGSVLVWTVLRSAIPRNNTAATLLGLSSGVVLAKLTYDYLDSNDKLVVAKKN